MAPAGMAVHGGQRGTDPGTPDPACGPAQPRFPHHPISLTSGRLPVPLTPGSPPLPSWLEFTFGLGDWTSPTDLNLSLTPRLSSSSLRVRLGGGDGSQPLFCLTCFPKPHRCEELVTLLFVQPYEWPEGLLTEGLFVCRPG